MSKGLFSALEAACLYSDAHLRQMELGSQRDERESERSYSARNES